MSRSRAILKHKGLPLPKAVILGEPATYGIIEGVTVSFEAPANPVEGAVWFDKTTSKMFVFNKGEKLEVSLKKSGINNTPFVCTNRTRTNFEYETVASLVRCLKAYEKKLTGDPREFMEALSEL